MVVSLDKCNLITHKRRQYDFNLHYPVCVNMGRILDFDLGYSQVKHRIGNV